MDRECVTAMGSMKMPRRLEGKVAVITASSAGIGLGIAERLGLEGASVVISSSKQLRAKGIDAIKVACNVNNADQRKNLIKTTVDKSHIHRQLKLTSFTGKPRTSTIEAYTLCQNWSA
ncbi:hypothetical protein Mapa_012731 [Marchantia paleacea]|nr:hypothetical protein Mapa_012731 [Marchantia paleacea]